MARRTSEAKSARTLEQKACEADKLPGGSLEAKEYKLMVFVLALLTYAPDRLPEYRRQLRDNLANGGTKPKPSHFVLEDPVER